MREAQGIVRSGKRGTVKPRNRQNYCSTLLCLRFNGPTRSRFNHFPRSALRYNSAVSDKNDFLELPGLRVTVDRVIHHRDAQTPPDRPHCFAYFITIHNDSDVAVTIKGRKWVVKNARGEITAVEGDGVVGQFPKIEPGKSFSYNSFHLNDTTTAVAEGSYIGMDERGRKVLTRIPKFKMDARGTTI
jgi:ApaG protein